MKEEADGLSLGRRMIDPCTCLSPGLRMLHSLLVLYKVKREYVQFHNASAALRRGHLVLNEYLSLYGNTTNKVSGKGVMAPLLPNTACLSRRSLYVCFMFVVAMENAVDCRAPERLASVIRACGLAKAQGAMFTSSKEP